VINQLPYCGTAPLPGELLTRFNLDPILIAALLLAAGLHLSLARRVLRRRLVCALLGWCVAAAAFLSPLCALSVALFSARVAQHMVLVLLAAPLIALGLPARAPQGIWSLALGTLAFLLALWFWHMPVPYDATFRSTAIYGCMHLSLFGSAVWLWYALLHHARIHFVEAFAAGLLTSIQMGMLGALLSLGSHPMFRWHLLTTQVWHLSPLEDQQLGGIFMWIPGIIIFLWAGMRGVSRLWAVAGAQAS
jgi:putative membrane protein